MYITIDRHRSVSFEIQNDQEWCGQEIKGERNLGLRNVSLE